MGCAVILMAADASEEEGKDGAETAKENVVALVSVESKPSQSDSGYKRQLSVREKAAAFLENTAKDSVC